MPLLGQSALAQGTTAVTPVYTGAGGGAAIQPGSLLLAFVDANMAIPAAFTLSGSTGGWTQRVIRSVAADTLEVELWDKIAVGGDIMPTFNGTAGTIINCVIAEVSLTTIPEAFAQSASGTVSPFTTTNSGTDTGTGRMIAVAQRERQIGAVTVVFTDNVNAQGVGVGVLVIGDNSGLSQAGHTHSIICTIAPTGVTPDSEVLTCTAGNHFASAMQSYYRGPIPVLKGWGMVPMA